MRRAPPRAAVDLTRSSTRSGCERKRPNRRGYAPTVLSDLPDDAPVTADEQALVLAYLADEIARILTDDDA